MTEKQATQDGLRFTGKYCSHNKARIGSVAEYAKEIRSKGFRAVVTTSQSGKAVYASDEYFKSLQIEEDKKWLKTYQKRVDDATAKYQKELDELQQTENVVIERLKAYGINP